MSSSNSCWNTARGRERLKARFSIRERVAALTVGDESSPEDENERLSANDQLAPHEVEKIKYFLRRIEAGSGSSFSLSVLENNYDLLRRPVPTDLLSTYKITTLCTSRFGKQEAIDVLKCVNTLESCTFMEYAAFLGEYRIIGSLLMGGLDPTIRGTLSQEESRQQEHRSCRSQNITSRLLKRFFDVFPLSLSSYIFKRVVDMRRCGLLMHRSYSQVNAGECPLCHCTSMSYMSYHEDCNHVFCESCLWEDILDNVDERQGDVVLCPVCHASPCSRLGAPALVEDSPACRRQASLDRFESLPLNSKELKARPKKKRTKKGALCSSWSEAVLSSLGNSQDVRRDKWFTFAERNALHHVRGCLVAGIDINMKNEYGQTALYIAAWRGYVQLLEVLLHYGAATTVGANGGSTALRIAKRQGHVRVTELLEQHQVFPEDTNENTMNFPHLLQDEGDLANHMVLTTLIDPARDHPGAGAFYIDNALSSLAIDSLIGLFRTIPVAQTDKRKKKGILECSTRSYFCDSEGTICRLIASAIKCKSDTHPVVFVHMRFLNYAHAGGVLAPHVDLFRVNHNAKRSSHTFILYLHDCKHGGATTLLEELSGREKILAKVAPRRGRLLVFPHSCPHAGDEVRSVPKLLLRGEVLLQHES